MYEYQLQLKDDELAHYGVLGMKWGVHRGRVNTAYAKAISKQRKLNDRVLKTSAKERKADMRANSGKALKYKKLQTNADKFQRKADKKKYGLIPNQKKATKLQVKADRAQFKANKYKDKVSKAEYNVSKAHRNAIRAKNKADKWMDRTRKTFKDKNVSEINKFVDSNTSKYIIKKAKYLDKINYLEKKGDRTVDKYINDQQNPKYRKKMTAIANKQSEYYRKVRQ